MLHSLTNLNKGGVLMMIIMILSYFSFVAGSNSHKYDRSIVKQDVFDTDISLFKIKMDYIQNVLP